VKNCARAYQSLSELVVYIKGRGPEQQEVVTDARHPSCYCQRERSLRTFWQTNRRSKARIEAAYQVYLLIDSFFIWQRGDKPIVLSAMSPFFLIWHQGGKCCNLYWSRGYWNYRGFRPGQGKTPFERLCQCVQWSDSGIRFLSGSSLLSIVFSTTKADVRAGLKDFKKSLLAKYEPRDDFSFLIPSKINKEIRPILAPL